MTRHHNNTKPLIAFALALGFIAPALFAQGTATGPFTSHDVVAGPTIHVGSAAAPIPIDLDPLGPPWTKSFTDTGGLTAGGATVDIIETVVNVGTEPWYDWHEHILPDAAGALPSLWSAVVGVTVNGSPITFSAGGVGTSDLWVDSFSQPVLPGDVFVIHKQADVFPNTTASGSPLMRLYEYPTPEPATAALLAVGGLLLTARRRRAAGPVAGVCLAALLLVPVARAEPVTGNYLDDPAHCDNHGTFALTHELGEAGFPASQSFTTLTSLSTSPLLFSCVGDDGVPNDWSIRLTNTSGVAWQDVFFVADAGVTVGNYDGSVEDPINAAGVFSQAFRIDALGSNITLGFESMTPDNILEVGEIWEILVPNFSEPGGPVFGSVGLFSGSSALGIDTVSNASILANPIPEPTSLSLLALGAMALVRRRRA